MKYYFLVKYSAFSNGNIFGAGVEVVNTNAPHEDRNHFKGTIQQNLKIRYPNEIVAVVINEVHPITKAVADKTMSQFIKQ